MVYIRPQQCCSLVGRGNERSPHMYKIICIVDSFKLHSVLLADGSIFREMGVIQPIIIAGRPTKY
jgi:hypothetical protein